MVWLYRPPMPEKAFVFTFVYAKGGIN